MSCSAVESTHESCESFECSRNARCRVDLYEYVVVRLDEHLQQSRLVEGRVQQGEETLVHYVGPELARLLLQSEQQ